MLLAFIITTNDETTTLRLIYKNRHFAVCFLCKIRQLKNYDYLCTIIHKGMETVNRILQEKITARIAPNKAVLTQLLPFELFSKKFCLNISELGLEIV